MVKKVETVIKVITHLFIYDNKTNQTYDKEDCTVSRQRRMTRRK